MRLSRILSASLIFVFPVATFAQSGMLDSETTLAGLSLLIAQYEARIKKSEAENAVLRFQMAKAGIQIPIVDLSWTTLPIPVSLPSIPTSSWWVLVSETKITTPTATTIPSATLSEITATHGKDIAGFISAINKDWSGIKSNYSFPSAARLAGYEFVQTGASDHVFADIVVGSGSAGIYDIKILYQYEKSTYKRKLIGIFEYNTTTSRYTTRSGSNPFGWVARTFVRDPYYAGTVKLPVTITSTSTGSSTPTVTTTPLVALATVWGVSVSEITKAYNEKRYLSTITLSNTYLEKNPATIDILNIRYRTYFIIGKYTDSLAELARIEKLWSVDKQTACNAQVIATYSKNQSLVDKYAAICKK
jgi:hypothetical protein